MDIQSLLRLADMALAVLGAALMMALSLAYLALVCVMLGAVVWEVVRAIAVAKKGLHEEPSR